MIQAVLTNSQHPQYGVVIAPPMLSPISSSVVTAEPPTAEPLGISETVTSRWCGGASTAWIMEESTAKTLSL